MLKFGWPRNALLERTWLRPSLGNSQTHCMWTERRPPGSSNGFAWWAAADLQSVGQLLERQLRMWQAKQLQEPSVSVSHRHRRCRTLKVRCERVLEGTGQFIPLWKMWNGTVLGELLFVLLSNLGISSPIVLLSFCGWRSRNLAPIHRPTSGANQEWLLWSQAHVSQRVNGVHPTWFAAVPSSKARTWSEDQKQMGNVYWCWFFWHSLSWISPQTDQRESISIANLPLLQNWRVPQPQSIDPNRSNTSCGCDPCRLPPCRRGRAPPWMVRQISRLSRPRVFPKMV